MASSDYVNVKTVANVRVLPLGTDNFGRDALTELVAATRVSLQIGLLAGAIATLIGLSLGLLSGYVGGIIDDVIMFITNLFIVIPPFVLLILISFSIGQDKRGASTVAMVIGLTSWVWTARAVRAQVFSLTQPRSRKSFEDFRTLAYLHLAHRHLALHRLIRGDGADPANFIGMA